MRKRERVQRSRARRSSGPSLEERSARVGRLIPLQLCFFLSGTAGLIYQVVWTKMLGQLFGNSAYAVATVLAVFMAGMAAGSALFGRWRPGGAGGIALYARLELAIAATALLSFPGIPLVRRIYLAGYPYWGGSAAALLALRVLGAALVLALPTILMGGTLPVLLAAISRESRELGLRAGRFYAANTGGAVAGTLAAGFFLLPRFGLRFTLATAVVLNLVAGVAAWKIASAGSPAHAAGAPRAAPESGTARPLELLCFAAVGATAMLYELGWTRLLETPLGSSTYAFSLMLATFLLGISAGSAIFEKWFRQGRQSTVLLFAGTQLGIAAAALASLWLYRQVPELLLFLLRRSGERFSGLLAAQAAACALPLLPLALLFGFNFPAVLALVCGSSGTRGEQELGGNLGRAVAANTAGAILGALAGGFLLLPSAGSFRLIALAGALNLVIAAALVLNERPLEGKALAVAGALLLGLVWTAATSRFFSQASAAFGVVLYRGIHSSHLTAREMADTEDVVFFQDGISSTIAVTRSEDYLALKTNGKVDASNLDAGTQLLLGDLGAVFHPHPRRVLIIGFGGGMTVSAVSRFPEVERLDCVEIEPAVLEAAPHLERLGRGVLGDPRLHVYFDDARNFLQARPDRYDLIISEPSNPWIAGIASLYTREFFETVRQHLSPGGSLVQWIQAYALSPGDLAMILASMQPAFRDLALWHSSGRDFLVLARDTNEPLSLDRARALWADGPLREDFEALHLSAPESWAAYFRLDHGEIQKLAAGAEINSDDNTRLEYSAPRHLLRESLAAELDKYVASFEGGDLARLFPKEDRTALEVAVARTALEVAPERAGRLIEAIPTTAETPLISTLRARVQLARGDSSGAAKALAELKDRNDNRYSIEYWLAIAQRDQGLFARAESTLDDLLAAHPDDQQALEAKTALASRRQDWPVALRAQIQLAALRPASAEDQCQTGDLMLRANEMGAAEGPLLRGLAIDSYAFLCHRDLGELYRARGRNSEAIRELSWVERYFPEADPRTYASLSLAYRKSGALAMAREVLNKGRRIFPADRLLGELQLSESQLRPD